MCLRAAYVSMAQYKYNAKAIQDKKNPNIWTTVIKYKIYGPRTTLGTRIRNTFIIYNVLIY